MNLCPNHGTMKNGISKVTASPRSGWLGVPYGQYDVIPRDTSRYTWFQHRYSNSPILFIVLLLVDNAVVCFFKEELDINSTGSKMLQELHFFTCTCFGGGPLSTGCFAGFDYPDPVSDSGPMICDTGGLSVIRWGFVGPEPLPKALCMGSGGVRSNL